MVTLFFSQINVAGLEESAGVVYAHGKELVVRGGPLHMGDRHPKTRPS